MGISTITSYKGAQLFEAVGISSEMINDYFGATVSKIGGVNVEELAKEILCIHGEAFDD